MNEKIDFSDLDPARDRMRFERMVDAIVLRAVEAADAPAGTAALMRQITAWSRPTLALAATLTLLVWAGALMSRPSTPESNAAVWSLSTWALNDQVPSATEILEVMNDDNTAN